MSRVDREFLKLTRRGTNSVFRLRGYLAMSMLNFSEIMTEIRTLRPTVSTILSQVILLHQNPEKRTAPLALLHGLIIFQRCHESSQIQRVNTVLLTEDDAYRGWCKPEVILSVKVPLRPNFRNWIKLPFSIPRIVVTYLSKPFFDQRRGSLFSEHISRCLAVCHYFSQFQLHSSGFGS